MPSPQDSKLDSIARAEAKARYEYLLSRGYLDKGTRGQKDAITEQIREEKRKQNGGRMRKRRVFNKEEMKALADIANGNGKAKGKGKGKG